MNAHLEEQRLEIPWDKLGIPDSVRERIAPDAPLVGRLAFAAADGELPVEVRAAALYVLATGPEAAVREAAIAAVGRLRGLAAALTQGSHAKVLEFIAEVAPNRETDERILQIRNTNDRTAVRIARRADAALCTLISENHERLLLSPDVAVALHGNPACSELALERVVSWLRMNDCLPPLPETRGAPPPPPAFDLEAEIQAALEGRASPLLDARKKLEMFDVETLNKPLAGFDFSFRDDDDFTMDMLDDNAGAASDDVRLTLEKRIAAMSTGKKIKLAYLGNKEVRGILIRDRSKMVSAAVVKSGRLTDSEVVAYAGNRNLHGDVLREIANNKEWMRKYPVQVSLVNNPRCPPSVGVSLVLRLQQKELTAVSRNRNVSSVVFQMATKLMRERSKHKKD